MSLFIDSHCHVFNFVDVPVHKTLSGAIHVTTVLKLGLILGIAVPKSILNKLIRSGLENTEDLIRFFEREIQENLKWIVAQIENAIADDDTFDKILFTPLIMDFDLVDKKGIELGEPSVERQYYRIQEAMDRIPLKPHVKICPFIGFDLRKLEDDGTNFSKLKQFWGDEGIHPNDCTDFQSIPNGKALGIKIYPPLGFNPYPSKKTLCVKYFEFYQWCCDNNIPLTVHCQETSFTSGIEKEKVNNYTHPENWERVLECEDLSNLRINFAHFGGDHGFEGMYNIRKDRTKPLRAVPDFNKNSWTYIILEMLEKYPNAYADISAFDYEENSDKMEKLFTDFKNGKFGATPRAFNLLDKIIWGTDVPLITTASAYRNDKGFEYKRYLERFLDCIEESRLDLNTKKSMSKKVCSSNAEMFLFGKILDV